MHKAQTFRLLAIGAGVAAFSTLGVTAASAATATPAVSCSIAFPAFNEVTSVISPALGTTYSLNLSNGSLRASWGNDYHTLNISYVKTGGSEITADFQQYGYTAGDNGTCFYHDDQGAFTESAGQTRYFSWTNAQLSDFTDAVMYVQGQGYFGIIFNYNNEG
jgi:hypothetical protein